MIHMVIRMGVIPTVILMVEVHLILIRMVILTMMNRTLEHQIQNILDFLSQTIFYYFSEI